MKGRPTKRNPIKAAFLAFSFGAFGMLYVGRFTLYFIIESLIILVLSLLMSMHVDGSQELSFMILLAYRVVFLPTRAYRGAEGMNSKVLVQNSS
jgi:hypothetical protein